MLSNFSRYYNTSSKIHLLNPLCKIMASIIFVLMVVMCSSMKGILALFLIMAFVVSFSNIPIKYFFKPLWSMKVLFLFIFLINLLFGSSIYVSCVMILKVCLIVLYSSILIMTTTTNDLALGFAYLLKPLSIFGVPVNKVSMAIALSLNFIPILFSEANKIMKSQMSRGFDYSNGSYKEKILGIKSIFIPMFVLAMRRADAVSDAMEVKQFSFDKGRSNIRGFRWRVDDAYMIFCHLVVLVLVLVKEVVM